MENKKEQDISQGIEEPIDAFEEANTDAVYVDELCIADEAVDDTPSTPAPACPACRIKEVVKRLFNRWFIDAFTGMAQGLFVTLIAGTILYQIASWCGTNGFATFLNTLGSMAKSLMGAGIGVGIAHKLKASPLVMFAAAVMGLAGAFAYEKGASLLGLLMGTDTAFAWALGKCGNPIGAYVVSLFAVEIAMLYAGKTKLDIVLVPLGMMLTALVSVWLAWPFIQLVNLLGIGIAKAIMAGTAVKIIVGVFVAVVMGILLTLPTSSAAIWVAITANTLAASSGYQEALLIAGGAAVAGCSAHMIGFAVASFRENKWGGLVSQGIGTSMLQIPNLMRNPRIMIPPIVASAFAGLSAVLFDLRCNTAGGGMGTSGLVGIFGVLDASVGVIPTWKIVLGILVSLIIIPAIISFFLSEHLRKVGWIKPGDQALDK